MLDDIGGCIPEHETPEGRIYTDGAEEINIDRLPKGSRFSKGLHGVSKGMRERYDILGDREPAEAPPMVADMFRGFLQRHGPIIRDSVSRTREQPTRDADMFSSESHAIEGLGEQPATMSSDDPFTDARAQQNLLVDSLIQDNTARAPEPQDVPRGRRTKHSRRHRALAAEERRRARHPEPVPSAGLLEQSSASAKKPTDNGRESINDKMSNEEIEARLKLREANAYVRALRMYGPIVVNLHKYTFDIMCERSVNAVWANYVCECSMRLGDRPVRSFRSRLLALIEQPLFIDPIGTKNRQLGEVQLIARFQHYTPKERDKNLRIFSGKTFGEIIDTNRFNAYIQDFLYVTFVFEFLCKSEEVDGQTVWESDLRVTPEVTLDHYVPVVEKIGDVPDFGKFGDLQCRLVSAVFGWHELGE